MRKVYEIVCVIVKIDNRNVDCRWEEGRTIVNAFYVLINVRLTSFVRAKVMYVADFFPRQLIFRYIKPLFLYLKTTLMK